MNRIFRTFIKAGGGATSCWKPESLALSSGQWRLSEALVVPGWVSPTGRVPLASGGVSLTVW